MKDRPKGLEKIAATGDTQQLSPGTTIGMAIGAEIPPGDPALIRTVRPCTCTLRINTPGSPADRCRSRKSYKRGLS